MLSRCLILSMGHLWCTGICSLPPWPCPLWASPPRSGLQAPVLLLWRPHSSHRPQPCAASAGCSGGWILWPAGARPATAACCPHSCLPGTQLQGGSVTQRQIPFPGLDPPVLLTAQGGSESAARPASRWNLWNREPGRPRVGVVTAGPASVLSYCDQGTHSVVGSCMTALLHQNVLSHCCFKALMVSLGPAPGMKA